MKFSVIVPVYNAEKYLRECLDSILAQTYHDFELILADDGSTDRSPAICGEYAERDGRVRVIRQSNSGVVKARQIGVEAARGEYLVFVDADDRIERGYLERFALLPSVDIVRCGYTLLTPGKAVKHPLPEREGFYSKKEIEREMFPHLIQAKNAEYIFPCVWGGVYSERTLRKQHGERRPFGDRRGRGVHDPVHLSRVLHVCIERVPLRVSAQ